MGNGLGSVTAMARVQSLDWNFCVLQVWPKKQNKVLGKQTKNNVCVFVCVCLGQTSKY